MTRETLAKAPGAESPTPGGRRAVALTVVSSQSFGLEIDGASRALVNGNKSPNTTGANPTGGLMAAHLQSERARAAGETLALIGLAAVLLDAAGKVLAANGLIRMMSDHVRWLPDDRLSLKDGRADQSLRNAIAAIDSSLGAAVRSFPVRDARTQTAMIAHVIRICPSARDTFGRCAAVLVLTPVALPSAPPVELVQSLFDLTPAEARVARDLAGGKTVTDIACDGGVSSNTVRTQVRRVLEKTGCSRQVDVIALLSRMSPPGGEHRLESPFREKREEIARRHQA